MEFQVHTCRHCGFKCTTDKWIERHLLEEHPNEG